ncbi:MAG TPA: hypothetical protein VIM07_03605 [Chitinophagaceae bacterium]|jgi:hypothetical protein
MKKKEILAIKKSVRLFKKDLEATQKLQQQLNAYRVLYAECLALLTTTIKETESLLGQSLAAL